MKYYIKAKNAKTGVTLIPVFTDRKEAQMFSDKFVELCTDGTELTVITQDENKTRQNEKEWKK